MFYTNTDVYSITNGSNTDNRITLTKIARLDTSKPLSSCNMSLLTSNTVIYIFNVLSNYISENLCVNTNADTL